MPREWVKELAVCEFMHRKLASPNYMSTSVCLPVCLHCSHVKCSTYCETFQDVASQNVASCVQPVFDSVCISFDSFMSLLLRPCFLLPYWIFFKSQYFSTFCDWRSHCSWFISNINPIEIASTIFIVEHLTLHEEMP